MRGNALLKSIAVSPSILGKSLMASRSTFIAVSAAVALAGSFARPARADNRIVRAAYFPGVSALPLLVAIRGGFFSTEGLEVTAAPTASSADLFGKLDSGALDLAHTSIDNPIAYDVGAGPVALAHRDFVAFLGVDDGLLRLVARPGIARLADLRGMTLAVDALATGFAFALRAMLATAGIGASEVTLVARGGTQQRADGLLAGAFDATLLTPPFDLVANAAGFATLGRAVDLLGPYQGISVIARREWLAGNRETALRYGRGYRAALAQSARDRSGSSTLLASVLGVTRQIAAASYDAAFAAHGGIQRNAAVDLDGVRTVLRLRARYAPPGAGDDPAPYVDSSIRAELR
jgi:ABC-type nitrate/sulfonate/bicarbonate transport system substrate-binding protein